MQVNKVATSEQFVEKFFEHSVLIYTGTVRLAKNILQNVVRNWYLKTQIIVNCFEQLKSNCEHMLLAFENEDLAKIGQLINDYWSKKKILAPSCEPTNVKQFFEKVSYCCIALTDYHPTDYHLIRHIRVHICSTGHRWPALVAAASCLRW